MHILYNIYLDLTLNRNHIFLLIVLWTMCKESQIHSPLFIFKSPKLVRYKCLHWFFFFFLNGRLCSKDTLFLSLIKLRYQGSCRWLGLNNLFTLLRNGLRQDSAKFQIFFEEWQVVDYTGNVTIDSQQSYFVGVI